MSEEINEEIFITINTDDLNSEEKIEHTRNKLAEIKMKLNLTLEGTSNKEELKKSCSESNHIENTSNKSNMLDGITALLRNEIQVSSLAIINFDHFSANYKYLVNSLIENTSIESLSIEDFELSESNVRVLNEVLSSEKTKISNLKLKSNYLDKKSLYSLVEGFKNNNSIKTLKLISNNIKDIIFIKLLASMIGKQIKSFKICEKSESCQITKKGSERFLISKLKFKENSENNTDIIENQENLELLISNSTVKSFYLFELEYLDLTGCNFSGTTWEYSLERILFKSLNSRIIINLCQLVLSNTCLNVNAIKLISIFVSCSKKINYLNLKNISIDDEGFKILLSGIVINNSLQKLCLEDNKQINPQLNSYLFSALRINQSLSKIYLENTHLHADNINESKFVNMLKFNSKLKNLYFSSRKICNKQFKNIVTCLVKSNDALKGLCLSNTMYYLYRFNIIQALSSKKEKCSFVVKLRHLGDIEYCRYENVLQ